MTREIILGDPAPAIGRPMGVEEPFGRRRLGCQLDDVGPVGKLRPRHVVPDNKWMTIEAPFDIMIELLARIEIGDRLDLPGALAELSAEVVGAMVAAPKLSGAGAVEQLFGVADAGAEESLVVALEVEVPDLLALSAGLVAEVGGVADRGVEAVAVDEDRAPPVSA